MSLLFNCTKPFVLVCFNPHFTVWDLHSWKYLWLSVWALSKPCLFCYFDFWPFSRSLFESDRWNDTFFLLVLVRNQLEQNKWMCDLYSYLFIYMFFIFIPGNVSKSLFNCKQIQPKRVHTYHWNSETHVNMSTILLSFQVLLKISFVIKN